MNEIGTPVSRDIISREDEPRYRSVIDHGAAGSTRNACRSGMEYLAVRGGLSAVDDPGAPMHLSPVSHFITDGLQGAGNRIVSSPAEQGVRAGNGIHGPGTEGRGGVCLSLIHEDHMLSHPCTKKEVGMPLPGTRHRVAKQGRYPLKRRTAGKVPKAVLSTCGGPAAENRPETVQPGPACSKISRITQRKGYDHVTG